VVGQHHNKAFQNMSQSGVKCLTTNWTQSNTKPLHCAMLLLRGPNTFSSSSTGLHDFSGIVRLLPPGHSTTSRGADDSTTQSSQASQAKVLVRLHTHRLFAGVGSGSGREVFHTYRHYSCRRCFRLRYLNQSSGTNRFRYV